MKQQSKFQIHRTRQRYYFHGARPSHLLDMRIRSSDSFADIPAIKSANGKLSTDPVQINAIFHAFYSKDKDPTECSSYRPLSLLNSDLKVFAKLLACRLESHMPSLVSSDQTGFIKSRLAADNVRCHLHIIDDATNNSAPISVLSLDAMKTFDQLVVN